MKKLTFLLFVTLLAAVSCKKDKPSPFAGNWVGGFTGSDQGLWRVKVSADGTLTGSGNSLRSGQTFPLEGSVSDKGKFKATSGVAGTGAEFTGTFSTDGKASGTWENLAAATPLEGTWEGERE